MTSSPTASNGWGYITLATDVAIAMLGRRDIMVVWHMTRRAVEWVMNLDFEADGTTTCCGPKGVEREMLVMAPWFKEDDTHVEG